MIRPSGKILYLWFCMRSMIRCRSLIFINWNTHIINLYWFRSNFISKIRKNSSWKRFAWIWKLPELPERISSPSGRKNHFLPLYISWNGINQCRTDSQRTLSGCYTDRRRSESNHCTLPEWGRHVLMKRRWQLRRRDKNSTWGDWCMRKWAKVCSELRIFQKERDLIHISGRRAISAYYILTRL